jgi:cytochrome b subunit of formate dehydrogenase
MISQRAIKKTDAGTVFLHWALAIALIVLVLTGLRIAADSASNSWLLAFDIILPKKIVWTAHIPAGIGLFAIAVAYTIYMVRAGLMRRIRPDRARLIGLFCFRRPVFVRAFNVLLCWLLFATLLLQIITGGLLYFGYGAEFVSLHLFATWVILAFVVGHIGIHFAIGGVSQLLRIVQPTRLPPPPHKFDPLELLVAIDERASVQENAISSLDTSLSKDRNPQRPLPPSRITPRPACEPAQDKQVLRWRKTTLQAHPLVVALGAAITATGLLLAVEREMNDTLEVHLIAPVNRPILDGDISDAVWREAPPVTVLTHQGANFDGKGATSVQIRAVHDGERAYFAFVWDDPTRSLKHLPLIKTKQGWRLLQEKYDRDDEDSYFEDKFAVLLSTNSDTIPGDRTFHSGRAPVAGMPATLSGRGLHYTTNNKIVDVWEWKATSSGESGTADDDYFGPPVNPTAAQIQGQEPYKGGFAADPGSAAYEDNFERRPPGGYETPLQPRRLPNDWKKMRESMGTIDFDPNHGEAEGVRWWMRKSESAPYSTELDTQIPVGTIIPGVVFVGAPSGDRADVQAAARWAAGRWTLEISRELSSKSAYDVPITTGTYLRVAAFDHSQSRHTRSVRPIRLEVEECRKCAQCSSMAKNSPLSAANCFSMRH